jgi:hypothetical protein
MYTQGVYYNYYRLPYCVYSFYRCTLIRTGTFVQLSGSIKLKNNGESFLFECKKKEILDIDRKDWWN